jgi:DNA-binding GntR family transcriptional regulator
MSVIEGFQEFYGNRQTPVSKEEHIERDRLFHTTIASYCDNQYLVQVLTNVYDQNSRARILSIRSDARQREAIQEHMAIIERMRERNAEAASEAMLQHILKAAEVAYHVVC